LSGNSLRVAVVDGRLGKDLCCRERYGAAGVVAGGASMLAKELLLALIGCGGGVVVVISIGAGGSGFANADTTITVACGGGRGEPHFAWRNAHERSWSGEHGEGTLAGKLDSAEPSLQRHGVPGAGDVAERRAHKIVEGRTENLLGGKEGISCARQKLPTALFRSK
jgi:hypothetical protein